MNAVLIFTLLSFVVHSTLCMNNDKVLLGDVKVLTLHQNRMTSYRRTSPIAQLNCNGGTARHECHKVKTVQCKNVGFDGKDYNWKCESQLDSHLQLGKAIVSCEGYNYPDDPYVLVGSCGLKFTLDYNPNYKTTIHTPVTYTTVHTNYNDDYFGTFIVFVCFVVIGILIVITICGDTSTRHHTYTSTSYVPTYSPTSYVPTYSSTYPSYSRETVVVTPSYSTNWNNSSPKKNTSVTYAETERR